MKYDTEMPFYSLFRLCAWLLIFFLAEGCKLKRDEPISQISVHLTLVDKNYRQLDKAVVFVFDNEGSYNQSLLDHLGKGGNEYAVSGGKLIIEGLQKGNYWIQCYATDTSSFAIPIEINNNQGGYIFSHDFKDARSAEVEIMLVSSEALVVFYTSSLDAVGPVDITINNKQFKGFITLPSQNLPVLPVKDGSAYAVIVSGNSLTYFAKGTESCSWTGKLNILPDKIYYVNLEPCHTNTVMFIGNNGTKIFLGENVIPAGTIGVDGLKLELPNNLSYNWFAVLNSCAWSGSVLVKGDTTINLSQCD